MPLELWIVLGLVVVAVAFGIVRRVVRRAQPNDAAEGKNVYPLW
jgi:hypothetical protein